MAVSSPLAPAAVVGCLVGRLTLSVLLALHPPVLEPDLDLSLRQVEVPCQLPPGEKQSEYCWHSDQGPGTRSEKLFAIKSFRILSLSSTVLLMHYCRS